MLPSDWFQPGLAVRGAEPGVLGVAGQSRASPGLVSPPLACEILSRAQLRHNAAPPRPGR